ncbi:MAG TPA: hypothetical protein VK426_03505 [Methanobacterium sp.]|nr:hypothetical protein [Methanobacterium sp.]
MDKYKVQSPDENKIFMITKCYRKLCKVFKKLKTEKGKIVHVIGAPGTGKSTNIFEAIHESDLNIYDVNFSLKTGNESSKEVFDKIFKDIGNDLKLNSKKEIYKKLSEFDAVLIADNFHDAHILNPKKVGFSQWTDKAGFNAFYFYILCIREYFENRKYFKKMNLIFQTAWRIYIRGKKRDVFVDFGFFSKIILKLLNIFFTVVEISYSKKETIEIIQMHINDVEVEKIEQCIQKYGCKPRFICHALEK